MISFGKLGLSLVMIGAAGTLGAAALAAGSTAQTPPPPGPGLDLIKERCGFCHTPNQALGVRKTPADWAIVVQSMIDRGTELTSEEQKVVTDYLATNMALTGAAPGAAAAVPPSAPAQH